ncbi:MAG: hypothetical protein HY809_05665 [Nitrospirae bacterium]|nr:hypothetical protein [Nitrospirota bacterium]
MNNQKGFGITDIVVLVASISIILLALLKGWDMIEDAKLKKFENNVRKWEEAAKDYYFIKGKSSRASESGIQSLPPSNPMIIGNLTFWVYYRPDGRKENFFVICADSACSEAFSGKKLKYVESFDFVIDGEGDGKAGSVLAVSRVSIEGSGESAAVAGFDANDKVDWESGKSAALVHYTDNRRR